MGIVTDALLKLLGVADHDREEIVEVVSDAAGQLTNRLHLLGLLQFGLGQLAFAQIDYQNETSDNDAVTVHMGYVGRLDVAKPDTHKINRNLYAHPFVGQPSGDEWGNLIGEGLAQNVIDASSNDRLVNKIVPLTISPVSKCIEIGCIPLGNENRKGIGNLSNANPLGAQILIYGIKGTGKNTDLVILRQHSRIDLDFLPAACQTFRDGAELS
ncbi:MAG: hypothetical protein VCD33_13710 [Alphaproteobacteria bacterium]